MITIYKVKCASSGGWDYTQTDKILHKIFVSVSIGHSKS